MNLKNRFLSLSRSKQIGIIIFILVITFFGVRQIRAKSTNTFTTTAVKKGVVTQTVKASGNVSASGQVSVFSTANGNISELYVKNGDTITAGQKLFRVKSTSTDIDKANAYATYLNAVNNTKVAQQNKLASQTLLEQARKQILDTQVSVDIMKNNVLNNFANPITGKGYNQVDMDSVYSALTSSRENFSTNERKFIDADTAISAASASQNAAWLSYQTTQDAYVTAPASGTVSNLLASIGDKVTVLAPGQTNTAQSNPVMVIGNFDNLYIIVTVNELNIAKIKLGQSATITFDGISGESYNGQVTSIDTVGQANQGIVSYNVRIDLKDVTVDNSQVKPGMTANVTINTQTKENILIVPNSAVFTDQGQDAVEIVVNNKAVIKHVNLGLKGDSTTEIKEGLSEGDHVIISPNTK